MPVDLRAGARVGGPWTDRAGRRETSIAADKRHFVDDDSAVGQMRSNAAVAECDAVLGCIDSKRIGDERAGKARRIERSRSGERNVRVAVDDHCCAEPRLQGRE